MNYHKLHKLIIENDLLLSNLKIAVMLYLQSTVTVSYEIRGSLIKPHYYYISDLNY